MTTSGELARELQAAVERESAFLKEVSETQSAERGGGPESWSRREELGHLIDSAVNNHWRFVRAALQGELTGPGYEQDGWVRLHGYHGMPWTDLIALWQHHNAAMVPLIRNIPEERLSAPCKISGAGPVTLRFLIEDYILHMQHHLDHVLRREKITQYPGAAVGV